MLQHDNKVTRNKHLYLHRECTTYYSITPLVDSNLLECLCHTTNFKLFSI
jgi:hypothetical protein